MLFRSLVVATRGPAPVTALEAAMADVGRALGSPVELVRPRVVGVLVLETPEAVVRVAVGPAAAEIDGAADALTALRAAEPAATVVDRLPTILARGRSGLAEWSAERRLPGAPASFPLEDWLLVDAVDFLVELHAVGGGGEMPLAAQAETVASVCGDEEARELRRLAAALMDELASLPLGFVHGDFWLRNLLVEGRRLVGVVDWDSGGPGRLPLVDLLQLLVVAREPLRPHDWGPAVVHRLLPWADAGGDDAGRTYCRRIGFEPDRRVLRALVAAYWLDRLAYQLLRHPTRARRPEWVQRSVSGVLRALT